MAPKMAVTFCEVIWSLVYLAVILDTILKMAISQVSTDYLKCLLSFLLHYDHING